MNCKTRRLVLASAASLAAATPAANAQQVPQPGDLLISVIDGDGNAGVLLFDAGDGVSTIIPPGAYGPIDLSAQTLFDGSSSTFSALDTLSGEVLRFEVSGGGLEGGPIDAPPLVGATGLADFDEPIIEFDEPIIEFDNPLIAFKPSFVGFGNPLIADDPSFDGFDEPIIEADDPVLFFGTDTLAIGYPESDDLFNIEIAGPPVAGAFAYPRNWLLGSTGLLEGLTAPLSDRLAGVLAFVYDGSESGIYRAALTPDALASGEAVLEPLVTGGVFVDPNLLLDEIYADIILPRSGMISGLQSGNRGAPGALPVLIGIDFGTGTTQMIYTGEPSRQIRDIVGLGDGSILALESPTPQEAARIVRIDRDNGSFDTVWTAADPGLQVTSLSLVRRDADKAFVTTTDDTTSPGSLRGEIISANASGVATDICVGPGFYVLDQLGTNEDGALTGDLDITGNVRILGAGASETIIDANFIDRVFHILPGGTLVLQDLTVIRGETESNVDSGANILSEGNLAAIRVNIVNGSSAASGGGIASIGDARLSMTRSFVRNNFGAFNGGLFVTDQSEADIDRCSFIGNASDFNSSGASFRQQSAAEIVNSSFLLNVVGRRGTVSVDSTGTVSFDYVSIVNNLANDSGLAPDAVAGLFISPGIDVSMGSSVIANNLTDGVAIDVGSPVNGASIELRGYCFFGSETLPTVDLLGDLTGTTINGGTLEFDPLYEPFPTLAALAPAAGSPLIDSANPSASPPSDMLDRQRPQNIGPPGPAIADIGAIELQPEPCPADVTGDNQIDLADLNLVLANFGQSTSDGDTNDDNQVDLADLNAVLASFGQACP